jgi:hypothetical protein
MASSKVVMDNEKEKKRTAGHQVQVSCLLPGRLNQTGKQQPSTKNDICQASLLNRINTNAKIPFFTTTTSKIWHSHIGGSNILYFSTFPTIFPVHYYIPQWRNVVLNGAVEIKFRRFWWGGDNQSS